jgi:hypothetical protein
MFEFVLACTLIIIMFFDLFFVILFLTPKEVPNCRKYFALCFCGVIIIAFAFLIINTIWEPFGRFFIVSINSPIYPVLLLYIVEAFLIYATIVNIRNSLKHPRRDA